MAYYLGYKKDFDYTKIDLSDRCSTDILDVIKYTCRFADLSDLKTELYELSLIPNTNVNLVYLIEKGKKGEKEYVKVPNLNQIYLYSSRLSFRIENIRNYLLENANNKELFFTIYASSLKKVGILEDIKIFLNKILSNKELLRIAIKELLESLKNSSISSILENTINGDDINLTSDEINTIVEILNNNNQLLCLTFNCLKKRLNSPFTSSLKYLRTIIILQNSHDVDQYALTNIINTYINSLIHEDNSDINKKINTRDIVDLGAIIQSYKEYCIEKVNIFKEYEFKQDDKDDEYLEPEDFIRENTTSDECGIYLRITDSMRWGSGVYNGY